MPRRHEGERVTGPYPAGKSFRLVLFNAAGEREDELFPTRQEALEQKAAYERELAERTAKTIEDAVDSYERFLVDKGNKHVSIKETKRRLLVFFSDHEANVKALTATTCEAHYAALTGRLAADSHRNYLAETKTFLNWCVDRRWLVANPAAHIKGIGRRKHGKEQLRVDEARKWLDKALELAAGEKRYDGPTAALLALLGGMRASEVVQLHVRDVDDGAALVWIRDAKTEAGKRQVEVPVLLRPHLARCIVGRGPFDPVFPARYTSKTRYKSAFHYRDWVREWVHEICEAAGVPKVTAHGMRGLAGTLARRRGAIGELVAAALGHESVSTTLTSYVTPEADQSALQEAGLRVLTGGRK